MTLNIKDDTADRLVLELVSGTGESLTTAISVAVRGRGERLRGAVLRERPEEALNRSRPHPGRRIRDSQSAEEILGYRPDRLAS